MAPSVGFLWDSIEGMMLSVMITPCCVVANKCCHNAVLSSSAPMFIAAFEACLRNIFMNQANGPLDMGGSSIEGVL